MNPFNKLSQNEFPIVVLTGGPGGGKTTLMRELRATDPECLHWVLVPEAAPLLFRAGLNACDKKFQLAVVRLQIALEETCMSVAKPGQVLVCDRGTLDALAYWLQAGWNEAEFFGNVRISWRGLLGRYATVLHLQTAAIGACMHYADGAGGHRTETAAHAAQLDELCAHAWSQHSYYYLLTNAGQNWPRKSRAAFDLLQQTSLTTHDHRGPVSCHGRD